jgi:hypothetical protein
VVSCFLWEFKEHEKLSGTIRSGGLGVFKNWGWSQVSVSKSPGPKPPEEGVLFDGFSCVTEWKWFVDRILPDEGAIFANPNLENAPWFEGQNSWVSVKKLGIYCNEINWKLIRETFWRDVHSLK